MNVQRHLILLAVLAAATAFQQGCTYAISPGLADRADRNVPFEALQHEPERYTGKLIVLGGTIAGIREIRQGTLLEITETPLDLWGKPERTSRSGGRFLILHPGRLNAFAYAPGRAVTVAGEVLDENSPVFAGVRYDLVVLLSKELKLWEQDRTFWGTPPWIDPLYDPDSPTRH